MNRNNSSRSSKLRECCFSYINWPGRS